MRARIGDKIRLLHIIDAMNEVEMYVKNIDTETWYMLLVFSCWSWERCTLFRLVPHQQHPKKNDVIACPVVYNEGVLPRGCLR
jgi:hypothetical protein